MLIDANQIYLSYFFSITLFIFMYACLHLKYNVNNMFVTNYDADNRLTKQTSIYTRSKKTKRQINIIDESRRRDCNSFF